MLQNQIIKSRICPTLKIWRGLNRKLLMSILPLPSLVAFKSLPRLMYQTHHLRWIRLRKDMLQGQKMGLVSLPRLPKEHLQAQLGRMCRVRPRPRLEIWIKHSHKIVVIIPLILVSIRMLKVQLTFRASIRMKRCLKQERQAKKMLHQMEATPELIQVKIYQWYS